MEKDDDTQSLPRVDVPDDPPRMGNTRDDGYAGLTRQQYGTPAAQQNFSGRPVGGGAGYAEHVAHGPARRQSNPWKTVVIFLLLIVGAIVLAWFVYTQFLTPSQGSGAKTAPVTTTVIVEETTVVEASQPAPEQRLPDKEPAAPRSQAPTSQFQVPTDAQPCGLTGVFAIYRGSENTTCGFAENTAIAMELNRGQSGTVAVKVNSPTTQLAYDMRCSYRDRDSYVCTGGDNAVVYLEHR
ncbi:putative serine/threonine protein kinase [Corynebacterium renale]|uniref:hypothetical protein n=1 Tax=Corynebacterium renale TaxID=1724 RepID=UPI000DA2BC08|nr:hypothetical protein [Corynebacterium renale]SQG64608.1 putative serine/threonine protein kinase [Corynebacterium renale]STC95710.1 putative serine/threonine protein kinase [Corynebacterium renale]